MLTDLNCEVYKTQWIISDYINAILENTFVLTFLPTGDTIYVAYYLKVIDGQYGEKRFKMDRIQQDLV